MEHKVLLTNRKNGSFSGILDVLAFDMTEILLETEMGMLTIKGKDLHVNRLNLEKGEVDVAGKIDSFPFFRRRYGKISVNHISRRFGRILFNKSRGI